MVDEKDEMNDEMKDNKTSIASFDIGKKNFAFCVERVTDFNQDSVFFYGKRYENDGTATQEFQSVINDICRNGELILMKNVDLTENTTSKYVDATMFANMIRVLDEYKEYWEECDFVLIEHQMNINTMALKMAQNCFTYFVMKYIEQVTSGKKTIIDYAAYHKTKILGAPKKMTKPQRKKWAITTGMGILVERKDEENIQTVLSMKKRDDANDCLTQTQSFKIQYMVNDKAKKTDVKLKKLL